MTDYYKILNVPIGASESEIKKQFRQLAKIYHPDKNDGSKKSEESFKIILNAYETLSDKEKRAAYNINYKQYQKIKTESTHQNHTNTKREEPRQQTSQNQNVNYNFWILVILIAILYLYNSNKTTTTGNPKADKQLKEQKPENRPESGELDFTNK